MNKFFSIILIFTTGSLFFITACTNNTQEPNPTYTLTQADLNKSSQSQDANITGAKYGVSVSVAHDNTTSGPDETYRDIYSTIAKGGSIAPGTIFTKRTYLKNDDGSKGPLLMTFAMAKRESGYYPNGGDWEYVMMPNDGTNDYNVNPNGMLPQVSATDMRGQLATCASCHASASSSDYIFSRGSVPSFIATQANLNGATNAEDLNITGTKYGADVSVSHNGLPQSPDSTYRDIYSNILPKEDIRIGAIFAKRVYQRNADGSRGPLLMTFSLIKREEGYYPDGGDFEYVMMPNDGSNDYDVNPNGMLPPVSATDMRGQLATCAACHIHASKFVFSRSTSAK
jgi:Cytochrome P460